MIKRAHTNLDYLMEERGLKNDLELAKELGWSNSNFSQRISGNISTSTLCKLSEYFEISVKDLLR